MFLLRKATAEALRTGQPAGIPLPQQTETLAPIPTDLGPALVPTPETAAAMRAVRVAGTVPPEVWNRLGTKILPKLRSGLDLKIGVEFSVTVPDGSAIGLATELRQILQELGLTNSVRVE